MSYIVYLRLSKNVLIFLLFVKRTRLHSPTLELKQIEIDIERNNEMYMWGIRTRRLNRNQKELKYHHAGLYCLPQNFDLYLNWVVTTSHFRLTFFITLIYFWKCLHSILFVLCCFGHTTKVLIWDRQTLYTSLSYRIQRIFKQFVNN